MTSMTKAVVNTDLNELQKKIVASSTTQEKIDLVRFFVKPQQAVKIDISSFSEEKQYVLYLLLAIGQAKVLEGASQKDLETLSEKLCEVETFYSEIGGLLGYHLLCLQLLSEKKSRCKKGVYHRPEAIDLTQKTPKLESYVYSGICHLDQLAEIYPIGGAADRLSTEKFQVAATFEFCGKTLIQYLIEDLQSREYLHYKMTGKHIRIPIVMMTSDEKAGDRQIRKYLDEMGWFGRKEEDFFIFSQPLVPTMNKKGKWCQPAPGKILFKPGGHGVIWKLAKECGALKWLEKRGITKVFIRQINNVIAGVDNGILAFLGIGFEENKDFGFAACPRIKHVSEGVDVVIETEEGFSLTNIEYCDLDHFQVEEEGHFLANTNLLFVDLKTIDELLLKCSIPGILINPKKMTIAKDREEEVMRLESTMQNLADVLIEEKPGQRTFITCNTRRKTISSIKKEWILGADNSLTPEQCFLDIQENGRELLQRCGFEVSSDVTFLYHNALGPLYSIIEQKLRKGKLARNSDLQLSIAEIEVENLNLDGSLLVKTDAVMGHFDEKEILVYSEKAGKCTLKNVKIQNSGVHRESSNRFWKNEIVYKQRCVINIEEGGEFIGENVTFRGDIRIDVPKDTQVVARMENGTLRLYQTQKKTGESSPAF